MESIFFTSDWHLSDPRSGYNDTIDLFFRSHLKSESTFLETILQSFYDKFKDGDTLFHLGDVVHTLTDSAKGFLRILRNKYPNSEFYFYEGNYDSPEVIEFLINEVGWVNLGSTGFHKFVIDETDVWAKANHYPKNADWNLNLVGHIHGAWRFNKKNGKLLINVGVDAWNYQLVSEKELEFFINACLKHYDDNVFIN